MKINRVRYLKGPNYFSYKPTLWIELDLEELEFRPSDTIPDFTESLLQVIPSLQTHTCSLGYEGGFVERLEEGTWMGHILEHMALELQSLAGIKVRRGKTITSEKKGIYFVTFDYKEPKSGLYSFEAAIEIIDRLLKGEKGVKADDYISKIESLYYEYKLGPSTEAIFNAAFDKKIPVERIGEDSLLRLGTGSKQKYVQATTTSQTSTIGVENSCDKQVTKNILNSVGVPVPKGEVATTIEEIFEAADRLGYPLVIKPLNGRQGQGVNTNIKSRDELFNVVTCMEKHDKEFIIERYYEGNDYRLLVVNGRLVAASFRMPPIVIGNGKDSIRTLIEEENKNPLRGDGHEKPMTKIPLNYIVSCYLEKWNMNLDYVPEKGRVIQVVGNANLSTGGQAIDVTDEVHPSIRDMAVIAAKAIGLDVAGVDVIAPDISKPLDCEKITVVEVNAAPGIRMHHYPSKGMPRNVGKEIVDYLFSERTDAAIPIVAITGTNGKTTTTRMVKHFLEEDGTIVGMTNSDGVYIGTECIDEGDCSGPISARKVLSHPLVDAAVLETARGGILREGLAFRHCDVGIVTNVSEDHLGKDGIETFDQLVKLKRIIPEVVLENGFCILNADDPEVVKMAKHTDGKVIFTSLSEENPHIIEAKNTGNTVWYMNSKGMIVCCENGEEIDFLPAKDVPITINGHAKHNISNLLQALAAAHTQGKLIVELRKKAINFQPNVEQSKGRFNILHLQGRRIVLDYAHNIAGLNAFFDTVQHLGANRIFTVFAAPGDRPDHDIKQMGKIAVRNSDETIFREDQDLRGRLPLETAKLLRMGGMEEVTVQKQIHMIMDEKKAYEHAWKLSQEGDLLIFLYDDFQSATQFIEKVKSSTSSTEIKSIS